jgi:hypothetical protein
LFFVNEAIRLRSTLHPPPGSGSFASMILRPENCSWQIANCTWCERPHARANRGTKWSPSIPLGHSRPPWPVPRISAGIYPPADVIRLAFIMVSFPFGVIPLFLIFLQGFWW